MKLTDPSITPAPRAYRQGARAAAAEATAERILDVFTARLAAGRFEDVTLDEIAAGAGVTRQTVIRRFGDKLGLMAALGRRMGEQVIATRARAAAGDPRDAVATLISDYEQTGDLVVSVLAQEDRSPALTETLNIGRAGHRAWVERSFGACLAHLPAALRERRLVQLVAVTDVWIWRLLRRDQNRPKAEVVGLMTDLVMQLLDTKDLKET